MAKLHRKYGRLDRVEARVHTPKLVHVFGLRTGAAENSNALGKRRVVRRHRAAIAVGAEVLAGVEAPRHRIAVCAETFALVARAVSLGGILDELEAMFRGELEQRVEV